MNTYYISSGDMPNNCLFLVVLARDVANLVFAATSALVFSVYNINILFKNQNSSGLVSPTI